MGRGICGFGEENVRSKKALEAIPFLEIDSAIDSSDSELMIAKSLNCSL